ncbi:MAG TPA: TMEM175 family protein [Jiangellaceae bacterium]|nr:TMEM175 family protein [Jiangellaceae bacterium]
MTTRYERDTSNFDRALGFFDAVYGFALTLLVTTIDITDVQAWQSLGDLLAADGLQLLSFLISFIVIVVFWRQNHAMIARFSALDSATIMANVVMMAFVVFIPFTTEAMGHPDLQELPLPTAMYAFNVGAAIVASIVVQQVGWRRGLVDHDESPRARRARLLDALIAPVVFFASIPVTYLGVALWGDSSAGKLFWLLLVVTGPVTGRWAERVARREG